MFTSASGGTLSGGSDHKCLHKSLLRDVSYSIICSLIVYISPSLGSLVLVDLVIHCLNKSLFKNVTY